MLRTDSSGTRGYSKRVGRTPHQAISRAERKQGELLRWIGEPHMPNAELSLLRD